MLASHHLAGAPVRILVALLFLILLHVTARAEQPLHQRIDQAIASKPGFDKIAASLTNDAEFLRRVHLDLAGTVPTAVEVRKFLADAAADKRAKLIDQLLASPEHARHMAHVLDRWLMERRPGRAVAPAAWHDFLRSSIAENKPWDQLVREILTADGADPKTRPAARFVLDRQAEPNLLTRDVGRLFLGTDLTCAQCHDHPVIDDYKQDHYYGIFAFFNRTSIFTDKGQIVLSEKADGDATFQSVFDPKKVTKTALPRLPGSSPIKEPALEKGKEYEVAPARGSRGVPKYSRRVQLAPVLATKENAQFCRAAANRFWAMLLGRGIVHPIDLDHGNNPASHPELLDLLGREFAAMNFDLRRFLREVALSQTYQRSSVRPASATGEVDPSTFAVAQLKPLSPEQLALALMQATGFTDAERAALGAKANEAAVWGKLSGNVGTLVTTFGGAPGQAESFQATLDQALFVTNGSLIRGWLSPRAGNLMDRVAKVKDTGAIAEEMFVSILGRTPAAEETAEIDGYLKARGSDRSAALAEVAWALLASAEFRFNH